MLVNSYEELLKTIYCKGKKTTNQETGVVTYVVPNVVAVLKPDEFPICTTRKSYWKSAIREFICYLRGYSFIDEFHNMGVKTWDNNLSNPKWQNSPHKVSDEDLGRIYGVQLREWKSPKYNGVHDQLLKVITNLKQGIDDRGEILTMWNPAELHMGCLRPCMYSHTFSLVDGTLHLCSIQRSADVPLGSNYNFIQAWFFLWWMSKITGHKQGDVTLVMNNAHIYENQMELVHKQIQRNSFDKPKFSSDYSAHELEHAILSDHYMKEVTDLFEVEGYTCHEPIQYPFTTTNPII